METLLLQTYLRSGKTLADLEAEYHISASRGKQFTNLVSLKYSMVESPMGEPIVQEARGIILDESDNWNVVARPFDKFFNYGEGHAKPLDWASARVQEKVDGSLMIMYHYQGQWRVGSSGTPEGTGFVGDTSYTFSDLFWGVWKSNGYQLPDESWTDFTFMFELATPYNRIVCNYPESRITLIGIRNRHFGYEEPVRAHTGFDWPVVKEFPLTSIEAILDTFQTLNPLSQEGYVVVDKHFNRVKVKHPAYVAIHHKKDGATSSIRNLMTIVLMGESSEFTNTFPEFKDSCDEIQEKYEAFCKEVESVYAEISGIESQKEFALKAIKYPYSNVLFNRRKGTDSIRQLVRKIPMDRLQTMLGLKEITVNFE